ncbi:hypothetical protein DPMN_012289 [Dreissena polymorpha]|uniref:Uncharacterized protein n=1 Tax=Dreissena polymorpha TaxID=45954 RepID=A0A9D4S384_DREPO|nr:hypothetical protein DPMN_012289 [Dreissena polymorpha]
MYLHFETPGWKSRIYCIEEVVHEVGALPWGVKLINVGQASLVERNCLQNENLVQTLLFLGRFL